MTSHAANGLLRVDGYTEADPTRVVARIPRAAIPNLAQWLLDNLSGRSEYVVLAGSEGNA